MLQGLSKGWTTPYIVKYFYGETSTSSPKVVTKTKEIKNHNQRRQKLVVVDAKSCLTINWPYESILKKKSNNHDHI